MVRADPQVIDAWFTLGNEYYKQERFTDAIRYFKRALELKPDYDLALINMANSYRALGKTKRRKRATNTTCGWTRRTRGCTTSSAKSVSIATICRVCRRRVYSQPSRSIRRSRLPATRSERSRFDAATQSTAERHIRAALADKPDVRLAHFNLALIAEAAGDTATASREYAARARIARRRPFARRSTLRGCISAKDDMPKP